MNVCQYLKESTALPIQLYVYAFGRRLIYIYRLRCAEWVCEGMGEYGM